MSEKYVRVKSWSEFKRLATELKPEAVVYSIDQNGLSKTKELTCLRLIMPTQSGYYVYLDFANGNVMRETGIPVRMDKLGNRCLQDEDIVPFLKKAMGRENLQVFSFWTT
ncbi:MAG: hypothetical protein QXU99_06160 [Candidatus Bathyarchaeia archaeon]